jgi:hypothetical protein
MTSPFLDSCPRCHGEKSFRLAHRRTRGALLLLKWVRRSTLRCTNCGYRITARLSAADKESLKPSVEEASGLPFEIAGPIAEPTAEGTAEFNAFIDGMQQREKALASPQDRTDRANQNDLGRIL